VRGELDRVGEEIQHDLLNLCCVGVRDDRWVVTAILVGQLLLLQLRADESFEVEENLVHDGRVR
jgi:hypothetical protein